MPDLETMQTAVSRVVDSDHPIAPLLQDLANELKSVAPEAVTHDKHNALTRLVERIANHIADHDTDTDESTERDAVAEPDAMASPSEHAGMTKTSTPRARIGK